MAHYVEERLKQNWSPERITGYLKSRGISVSKKAIYKYIHAHCLERHLFWRKYKRKRGFRSMHMKREDGRRYIDLRPRLDGSGHWEADFIVCRQSSAALLVVVDRYTLETRIAWLPNRKRPTLRDAFERIFVGRRVVTLTLDNDVVLSDWRELERILTTVIYFCHPYHSWEKGLVENTNRWIRCSVPKRRDISTVSIQECRSIESFLNNVPRQRLGYLTAMELTQQQTRVS